MAAIDRQYGLDSVSHYSQVSAQSMMQSPQQSMDDMSHLKSMQSREKHQSTSALGSSKGLTRKKFGSLSNPSLRRHSPAKSSSRQQKEQVDNTIRAALRSSGGSRGGSRGGLNSRGGLGDVGSFGADMLVPGVAANMKKASGISFDCIPGSAEHNLHELQDLQANKTEIELKLEQYVGNTFNRILERKAKLAAVISSKSLRGKASSSASYASLSQSGDHDQDGATVTASQILSDTAHDPSGLTGLGLHYFTESDRFQCMCLFLSDPLVFTAVVEEISRKFYGVN